MVSQRVLATGFSVVLPKSLTARHRSRRGGRSRWNRAGRARRSRMRNSPCCTRPWSLQGLSLRARGDRPPAVVPALASRIISSRSQERHRRPGRRGCRPRAAHLAFPHRLNHPRLVPGIFFPDECAQYIMSVGRKTVDPECPLTNGTSARELTCATQHEAVGSHFVALATYLGHKDITNIYWYLEATPELMSKIAAAAEALIAGEAA